MRRPAAASATAFATTFPPADTRGTDTMGTGAPTIAVDQTVYLGPSPGTVSGQPAHVAGFDEQAPAVADTAQPEVETPADLYARAGEIAAGTGSSDRASQDTAGDPQSAAELLVWSRAGARAAGIPR
jgi:hypothetical protein